MSRWALRARIGLNLGPSPIHAQNVYLVLNLVTGCVSPQYHFRFDDFFETMRHGGPDISSSTICWQQLAGLSHADLILSELVQPTQRSMVSNDMPSEMPVPPDGIPASTFDHAITADEPQAPTQAEGANPTEHITVSAGTSCSGRVRIMSQRMVESVSQRDFFGTTGMHYMAQASTIDFNDTPEDLFHNQHLDLQEGMQNPIAFHAEMMGLTSCTIIGLFSNQVQNSLPTLWSRK
jgi:hypothetical protein